MDRNKFGVRAGLWFLAHSALTPPECPENEHSAFQTASFAVISRTRTLRRRIINTESIFWGNDIAADSPRLFPFPAARRTTQVRKLFPALRQVQSALWGGACRQLFAIC